MNTLTINEKFLKDNEYLEDEEFNLLTMTELGLTNNSVNSYNTMTDEQIELYLQKKPDEKKRKYYALKKIMFDESIDVDKITHMLKKLDLEKSIKEYNSKKEELDNKNKNLDKIEKKMIDELQEKINKKNKELILKNEENENELKKHNENALILKEHIMKLAEKKKVYEEKKKVFEQQEKELEQKYDYLKKEVEKNEKILNFQKKELQNIKKNGVEKNINMEEINKKQEISNKLEEKINMMDTYLKEKTLEYNELLTKNKELKEDNKRIDNVKNIDIKKKKHYKKIVSMEELFKFNIINNEEILNYYKKGNLKQEEDDKIKRKYISKYYEKADYKKLLHLQQPYLSAYLVDVYHEIIKEI